jgi:hypothetical protein
LFHADGHTDREKGRRKDGETDMTKPIVFFYNFAKAPEKRNIIVSHHMRRYRNLPLSYKLYQHCPSGFERVQNIVKILRHARFSYRSVVHCVCQTFSVTYEYVNILLDERAIPDHGCVVLHFNIHHKSPQKKKYSL